MSLNARSSKASSTTGSKSMAMRGTLMDFSSAISKMDSGLALVSSGGTTEKSMKATGKMV